MKVAIVGTGKTSIEEVIARELTKNKDIEIVNVNSETNVEGVDVVIDTTKQRLTTYDLEPPPIPEINLHSQINEKKSWKRNYKYHK